MSIVEYFMVSFLTHRKVYILGREKGQVEDVSNGRVNENVDPCLIL